LNTKAGVSVLPFPTVNLNEELIEGEEMQPPAARARTGPPLEPGPSLRPWTARRRGRREPCCLEASSAALLSSTPR